MAWLQKASCSGATTTGSRLTSTVRSTVDSQPNEEVARPVKAMSTVPATVSRAAEAVASKVHSTVAPSGSDSSSCAVSPSQSTSVPVMTGSGNGWTVKVLVSEVKQLRTPFSMVRVYVPGATLGSSVPSAVTPVPLHVAVAGAKSFIVTSGSPKQASTGRPGSTCVSSSTTTVRVSLSVQPLTSVYV